MELQMRAMQHIIATMIIVSFLVSQNLAQVQRPECLNELQPCLNYLNGNNRPPDSCCQPLDYVTKSRPECLCRLMSIQGANQAQQAGINVTEAQTLPGRCGQHINPLGCVTGTPDTRSRNSVPSSVSFRLSSVMNLAVAIMIFVAFRVL